MDAATQQSRFDTASRILESWGLDAHEKDQLLDDYDKVLSVLSIAESLNSIFGGDTDRACQWPSKANHAFGGATAVEVMLNGEYDRVAKYLRHHVYNS